jgi:hypothetical protein
MVMTADIRSSAGERRTEMNDLGNQLRTEISGLRDEVRTGSSSATADRIAIEGRLRNGIADVRSELLRDQRNLVFSFIGANVAIATLAVTVQQLLG